MTLGGLLVVAQSWIEFNYAQIVADRHATRYGRLVGLRATIGLALAGVAARFAPSAEGFVAAMMLGYGVVGLWLGSRDWRHVLPRAVSAEVRRSVVRFGLPLAVASSVSYLVGTADRMLLGVLVGSTSAGLFAATYDLTMQPVTLLMTVVNLAAYPRVVGAFESQAWLLLRQQAARQFTLLVGFCVPAAAGLIVLRRSISGMILGNEFAAEASSIMPLIAVASLLAGVKAFYFDLAFHLSRRTDLQVLPLVGAALVNIVATTWLAPRIGPIGAAWGTVAGFATGLVLSVALSVRAVRLPVPWPEVIRILVATSAMVVALYPALWISGRMALLVQIGVGVGVYGTAAWMLNVAGVRRMVLGAEVIASDGGAGLATSAAGAPFNRGDQ